MTAGRPDDWMKAVVKRRRPLRPIETDVAPRLDVLPDIRAVIFDVYGTLIISGSGEVGTAADPTFPDGRVEGTQEPVRDPIAEALRRLDLSLTPTPRHEDLLDAIAGHNRDQAAEGRPSPEVEILDVWYEQLLNTSAKSGQVLKAEQRVSLAATYEAIANPTWPMPGAAQTLSELHDAGLNLGIVSNAQVFTIPLVESLTGCRLDDGPFDPNLCVFSYRYRQSKPGPRLFEVLTDGLRRRAIRPEQALYVGNDMLNDVWAASEAGLRTAWFVGDARSIRARQDDRRCRDKTPDLIVNSLEQVLECLG